EAALQQVVRRAARRGADVDGRLPGFHVERKRADRLFELEPGAARGGGGDVDVDDGGGGRRRPPLLVTVQSGVAGDDGEDDVAVVGAAAAFAGDVDDVDGAGRLRLRVVDVLHGAQADAGVAGEDGVGDGVERDRGLRLERDE